MLCNSCGKQLDNASRFCNYCGNKVAPVSDQTDPQTPIQAETIPLAPAPSMEADDTSVAFVSMDPTQLATGPIQPQQADQDTISITNKADLQGNTSPAVSSQSAQEYHQPAQQPQQSQNAIPSFQQFDGTGAATSHEPRTAPNCVQRIMLRLFSPTGAENPWLGIALGGVGAALVGTIFFILLLSILNIQVPTNGFSSPADLVYSPLTIIPTGDATHNGIQALLTAQGISRRITGNYTTTGANIQFDAAISSPLQLTLLIPALLLILGGYVAASTDRRNQLRSSLWRGAAIAVPYVLILLLLATQAGGDLPTSLLSLSSSASTQGQYNLTLGMDTGGLIFLGLFWGVIFGLLGASLKLAAGHWRNRLHYHLYNNPWYKVTAILAGGIVAIIIGCLLTSLFAYVATAPGSHTAPGLSCLPVSSMSDSNAIAISITSSPFMAVQIFAFSFGTPILFTSHTSGLSTILSAFSSSLNTGSGSTSCSLFNNMTHISPWFYLILLVPICSLLIGGRISARFGRPQSPGTAAVQGALIAIPFAIIMMILAQLSNINVSMDLTGTVILLGNIPQTGITISVGAGVIDVMLWSLLSGAVLGALGGIYQFSTIGQNIDSALVSIAHIPLRLLEPFFMLFDQLSGRQRRKAPRGRALTLLYSTLCVTVIVTALSVGAGILLMSFSTLITYDLNSNIHSIMNTLVIILPGLLLVGTLVAVIMENPQAGVQTQENTEAPLNQPAGGTI